MNNAMNDDRTGNRNNLKNNNNVTSISDQLECDPSCADKIIGEDGSSSCSQVTLEFPK